MLGEVRGATSVSCYQWSQLTCNLFVFDTYTRQSLELRLGLVKASSFHVIVRRMGQNLVQADNVAWNLGIQTGELTIKSKKETHHFKTKFKPT